MAKGWYCARHNNFFGTLVPCSGCEAERTMNEPGLRLMTPNEEEAFFKAARKRAIDRGRLADNGHGSTK